MIIDGKSIWDLDRDGLDLVNANLKAAYSMLQRKAVVGFRVGDKVSFNGKYGSVVFGEIVGLNSKTISVKANGGVRWKVSATLLKKEK